MATFSNAYGAVGITDGGTPRVITVKARENISGGYWVLGSSAAGALGSGAESYAAFDIEGFTIDSVLGSSCVGLALQDIPSGTYGPVAQRGVYLLPVYSGTDVGSVVGGMRVAAGSAGTVIKAGSSTLQDFEEYIDYSVGRSMSTGGGVGNQFVAVSLNI